MNYEMQQIIADNFGEIERFFLLSKLPKGPSAKEKALQDEIVALRSHLTMHLADFQEYKIEVGNLLENYQFVRQILECLKDHSGIPDKLRAEIRKGYNQSDYFWRGDFRL